MPPSRTLLFGLILAAFQPAIASSSVHADMPRPAIDESRFGTKTAEVIPIPEPTSAVLGLIATAAILLRRRFG